MNIKTLAALAISIVGLSASHAFAGDHGWHGDDRGRHGGWDHDRRGYDGGRWDGHREDYRAPRWNYGYAPRYYAPRHYAPANYAPSYYAPSYYAPNYDGGWFDNLGVVIQLHLP